MLVQSATGNNTQIIHSIALGAGVQLCGGNVPLRLAGFCLCTVRSAMAALFSATRSARDTCRGAA